MENWVYSFGDGRAEGKADMRDLLGGKGANLAEMSNLGLPVPPGFTVTTEVCTYFYDHGLSYPETLTAQVSTAIRGIEKAVGAKFGDVENPLLVSVRSGARVSMPGMMDTVLNLGLNDETVKGLAQQSGNERFAYDSYRRFIQMYADVVLGIDHYIFEEILEIHKEDRGVHLDTDLDVDDLKNIVAEFIKRAEEELGDRFPQDPSEQLWGAIGAVFKSWQIDRARTYRRIHDIPDNWGTAVNIQAMVFGNMGDDSATGVAFTRDPATGENTYYGEYLINAQGEDVVAGIRTPQHLTTRARKAASSDAPSMEEVMPEVFGELTQVFDRLETHYRDMQDIEFTVQRGKLWMLQTRGGKRTGKAALKIAVEMARDGLIKPEEAVLRVDAMALDQLLHPTLDPDAPRDVLAKGLPASPGAAVGKIVLTADEAEQLANAGEDVILVRVETSPEDIHGMHAARGILTARGGMTSHAAVVARGMGRPCVSGVGTMQIDREASSVSFMGRELKAGDVITIDGTSGEIMAGAVEMVQPELAGDFAALMEWADQYRRMKVRANAETPEDCETARGFGAEGIGLCRTEHMFFHEDRIIAVREMILADGEDARRAAIEKLLSMQQGDFAEIFRLMNGLPVTIRLLDPPLHEFLPHQDRELEDVAEATGLNVSEVRRRAKGLTEMNPMLGHRGCRLAITYPEIYEMQARAIFQAAIDVERDLGQTVIPEIMVPLVATSRELEIVRDSIVAVGEAVFAEQGHRVAYQIGTMIELPRAALRAGEIAKHAEFFSFGTNDLTQTTLGLSRDDSSRFLEDYVKRGIFERDPFVTIDANGVGELINLAAERGRESRPEIKLGICGEHGGEPASIRFCERVGLEYVSCSPYRVPIARLAAAQAALESAD